MLLTARTKNFAVSFDGKSLLANERIIITPALPKEYEKDGEHKDFVWTLRSTEQKGNAFSLLYFDKEAGFNFLVMLKGRDDICGPVEYSAALTNLGATPVRIFPGDVFDASFPFDTVPTAWRVAKESGIAEGVVWHKGTPFFQGTGIYKDMLTEGKSVLCETSTVQDFNSGGMIPMIYLDAYTSGAYVAVEWTSQRIYAEGTKTGARIHVDYREGFTTRVAPGEPFTVEPVYIGSYKGDIEDGSNEFKRWFFMEKTPKKMFYDENEPLTQIDLQFDPEECAEHGIQSLKWDYGWWSDEKLPNAIEKNEIWKYYEGSWKLRCQDMIDHIKRLGCDTLEQYGEYLEKFGLNWTVYTLLHDSQKELEGDDLMTSIGPTAHPEWFSDRKIADQCPVADLGNKECIEYCKRKLQRFFTENKIKGWRTDFEPIAFRSDKENRHDANGTDVQYWCSKGFYEIVDYLIEKIPGFRYESCSSGGSMKDFATMHRCVIFNTDDSADFASLRTTFYDSSYCFPPAQLQWPLDPCSFSPEHEKYYCGYGDRPFGFRSLIMAGIHLGSWGGRKFLNDYNVTEMYKEYLHLHNTKVKHLIRHANLYHTLPRPDGIHWDGMQYGMDHSVNGNKIHGAAFIFKPSDKDGDSKHIDIRGLCPDAIYKADFYERKDQSFIASGKEIMEKGITVYMDGVPGSDIIFFEQI